MDNRPPPSSPDMEAALLGSIMLDSNPPAIMEACIEAGLTPDSFYAPANHITYAALAAMHDKDKSLDAHTVFDYLHTRGEDTGMGGILHLTACMDKAVPTKYGQYIDTVKGKHTLRQLQGACMDVAMKAYTAEDAGELVAGAEAAVAEVGESGEGRAKIDVAASWDDLERRMESGSEDQQIGIDTGIDYWDHEGLLRFRPGGMYLLMGKQKCFKSTLAFHICNQQLFRGRRVGLATLEMPHNQALAKMGGAIMGCNVDNVMAGKEVPSDGAIQRARDVLRSGRLQVEDSIRTVDEWVAWYRRGCRKHKWDFVVLDYLQRLQCRGKDRWDIIAHTSERITAAAKDVGVPVLCLAMLTVQDGQVKMYGAAQGGYDCYASLSIWRDMVDDPVTPGMKRYEDDGFPDYSARAWLKITEQRFGASGKTIPITVKGRTGEVTVPKDAAGIAAMMGQGQQEDE